VSAGTLQVSEDHSGLFFRCDLSPKVSWHNDVRELIKRGDVNGCSFAFTIPEGGQAWSQQRGADGIYFVQREISDANLLDVSPVTQPAYSGTSVDARSCPPELCSVVEALNYGETLFGPRLLTHEEWLELCKHNQQEEEARWFKNGITREMWDAYIAGRDLSIYPPDAGEQLSIRARKKLLRDILD
jgi:hypothetical protein